MKATIQGFRYDTDKAILVREHEQGTYVTDFSYWTAGLYRTTVAGRYFLAGEGGPMTRFARRIDANNIAYGARILPLSDQEAAEWLMEYPE